MTTGGMFDQTLTGLNFTIMRVVYLAVCRLKLTEVDRFVEGQICPIDQGKLFWLRLFCCYYKLSDL